jgi:hypothetical protein
MADNFGFVVDASDYITKAYVAPAVPACCEECTAQQYATVNSTGLLAADKISWKYKFIDNEVVDQEA